MMHRNLSPIDIAQVILRLNYDRFQRQVSSPSTYPFLTFTARTLCFAMTLTFDPLIWNVCNISADVIMYQILAKLNNPRLIYNNWKTN